MPEINNYSKEQLLDFYYKMFLIRRFEERVKFLFLEGSMPGTIHQCQGQEATAVGVCGALNIDDYITSTHRPHGHALAKGLSCKELLAELYGKATGCCKGKGGSMHVGNMQKGMVPAIAIVGGGIPLAAGIGLAFKMKKTKQVAVCFFGDGASSEGAFHEAVNMAAIWNLPVIFACENNFYGASTHIKKVTRLGEVAGKAAAYGIKAEKVDGNDVLAVYEAAQESVKTCRKGQGPVLLELETYRITGHSRRDPCAYQPKEERQYWNENEPIKRFSSELLKRSDITQADLDIIETKTEDMITEAIMYAQNAPEPTLDDLEKDVYV